MGHAITIKSIDPHKGGWHFLVEVGGLGSAVSFSVELDEDYWKKLAGRGSFNDEKARNLVKKSFEFLLSKEPKESILGSFNLRKIQEFFPDYEAAIRAALEE